MAQVGVVVVHSCRIAHAGAAVVHRCCAAYAYRYQLVDFVGGAQLPHWQMGHQTSFLKQLCEMQSDAVER
jgi:hypothetical protein